MHIILLIISQSLYFVTRCWDVCFILLWFSPSHKLNDHHALIGILRFHVGVRSSVISVSVCPYACVTQQESQLPLTDPPDTEAKYSVSSDSIICMVFETFLLLGLAAEYRSRWWVWWTVVRRPSEVYDRRTKLTAPETVSPSGCVENRRLNLLRLYLAPPLMNKQTDRRTRHDDSKYRASIASRG